MYIQNKILNEKMLIADRVLSDQYEKIRKLEGSAENDNTKQNWNISITDAVNFTDGYYNMFKIKLPKIVGNSKTIEELNTKILNEQFPKTYDCIIGKASVPEAYENGAITEYKHIIKNNVLVIYIYTGFPAGSKVVGKSGTSGANGSYYYDIKNDKILSVGQAAKALEMKIEGMTSKDEKKLESYEDLDQCNDYSIIIDENELKFQFLN